MGEVVAELFILAVIFGPAAICIIQYSRSDGDKPSRDGMLLALVWTIIMLGVQWAHHEESNADLKRTCRQLEKTLVLSHHDADYEAADDLPEACLLALGYEDPPDPDDQ